LHHISEYFRKAKAFYGKPGFQKRGGVEGLGILLTAGSLPWGASLATLLALLIFRTGTVMTCFQQKEVDEGRDPHREGDLFTEIRDHLSSEPNALCSDAWDVAALIIKHAVTALLDRVELTGPQVFRTFGGYIQELVRHSESRFAKLVIF
jgi:hypothetical protein